VSALVIINFTALMILEVLYCFGCCMPSQGWLNNLFQILVSSPCNLNLHDFIIYKDHNASVTHGI
jgi:hypothetical protein